VNYPFNLLDQEYSKNCNIVKKYSCNAIYSWDVKSEFSHHSVSHDPSEIILTCWFAAKRNISDYHHWFNDDKVGLVLGDMLHVLSYCQPVRSPIHNSITHAGDATNLILFTYLLT